MKHSQHNIEDYIDEYFHLPGFFLEIGAWDGDIISQTAWLEQERGWNGLCVDPFPHGLWERSCKIAPFAISRDGQPREFIKVFCDKRDNGDVSYFSGFRDSVSAHWPLIRDYCEFQIMEIQTMTLETLYKTYHLDNYIDFLSVDTEGAELEIFESIRWDLWKFGMIVFEHNGDPAVQEGVGCLLTGAGYVRIDSLFCDDIYISGSMVAAPGGFNL